jgi:hypothetical protein
LTWATAAFCLLRGMPVLLEGWQYFAKEAAAIQSRKSPVRAA